MYKNLDLSSFIENQSINYIDKWDFSKWKTRNYQKYFLKYYYYYYSHAKYLSGYKNHAKFETKIPT